MNTSMITQSRITLLLTIVSALYITGVAPVHAEQVTLLDAQETWQNNRLLQPTPNQIEQEQKGNVVIYDGLKDITIDEALDQYFDRIQNMMFTRIIRTGKAGKPLQDEAGNVVMEDDGC